MFTLKELIENANTNHANIEGKWVPARPVDKPFPQRIIDAWLVLRGKADAFTWPEGQ